MKDKGLSLDIPENYGKKEIILDINIAEFLVLRDLVFCNYPLLYLKAKMRLHILKEYKEFHDKMVDSQEVKVYWDYIKNYKIKGSILQ